MNDVEMMSPTKVAEQYGGDKQKIAQAVQMGLIDPTVGVMAGMFIDRVRNAAAVEQAPRQTVAQQVLSPQPTPQPQAQPQQAGLQAAAAAPVERGLAALPVDESMVPGGEGYAGGGIVAFANRGFVDEGTDLTDPDALMQLERQRQLEMAAAGKPLGSNKPTSLEDFITMAQQRRSLPLSEAEQALQERYKSAPERAKESKERSTWEFLTELGFGAAGSKSPYALQAFGESGKAAMPRLTAGAKEARELEETGMKGLAEMGKTQRLEQLAGISAGEKMFESAEDRANRLAVANIPAKELQVAAQLRKDNPNLSYFEAIDQASKALSPKDTYNATRTAVSAAAKDANAEFTLRATYDPKLMDDMKKAAQGDAAAQARVKAIRDRIQEETFKLYQVQGVDLSAGKIGTTAAADPLGIRR